MLFGCGVGIRPPMATCAQIFDRFAAHLLPQSLSEGVAVRMRSLARLERIGRGMVAPVAGDGQLLAFIADGAAKLVAHTASGREQILGFYFASDLLLLPARAEHGYALHGLTDCTLLVMPHHQVREIACADPVLAVSLLDSAERSLSRCRDKAVTLGRKTASERMAGFLLSMVERAGTPRQGAIVLDLPMSRRDIADGIGLTIETVSRQLSQLREDGLISTSGRSQVTLLDPSRLKARAGFISCAA